MWLFALLLLFPFIHNTESLSLEDQWDNYCEALKTDVHATFIDERLPEGSRGRKNLHFEQSIDDKSHPGRSVMEELALKIHSQMSDRERAKICDDFTPDLEHDILGYKPTCHQICLHCFVGSAPVCMLRRPGMQFMKTCLCTFDSESPLAKAAFSFRHDKRVERLLRGRK